MRSYLYANVVQVVISCIIMGGAANNITDSSKYIANMAFKSNASHVPTGTPSISLYEPNMALTSNTIAINNGVDMDESKNVSISSEQFTVHTTAKPITNPAPQSASKYFISMNTTLHNRTDEHSMVNSGNRMSNVNSTHKLILANSPLNSGTKVKATIATPNQSKKVPSKDHRTDAPMLNYIFDSISAANKHHHHDHKYGPNFEDLSSEGSETNITVHVGNTVYLNCRISLLQDKTVSWVRRRHGESNLELLTVGKHAYSADPRYTVEFQYPSNWRLKIESVVKEDESTFICQISTHPPRVITKNMFVNDPKVIIIDEKGAPLQEKYYEVDSTIQLSCIVRHVIMTTTAVYWSHGERILNYDVERGGISVKTEILEKGANSTLFIAKANNKDSGLYSCFINSTHAAAVSVHVLNGESFAELHHGNNNGRSLLPNIWYLIVHLLIVILLTARDQRR